MLSPQDIENIIDMLRIIRANRKAYYGKIETPHGCSHTISNKKFPELVAPVRLIKRTKRIF